MGIVAGRRGLLVYESVHAAGRVVAAAIGAKVEAEIAVSSIEAWRTLNLSRGWGGRDIPRSSRLGLQLQENDGSSRLRLMHSRDERSYGFFFFFFSCRRIRVGWFLFLVCSLPVANMFFSSDRETEENREPQTPGHQST